jgi:hypothetical protein
MERKQRPQYAADTVRGLLNNDTSTAKVDSQPALDAIFMDHEFVNKYISFSSPVSPALFAFSFIHSLFRATPLFPFSLFYSFPIPSLHVLSFVF